ncbi:unnamed protein product [Closterium sp. NIES-54]
MPLPDDPTPQQLREWVIQRACPDGGGFGFLQAATLGASGSAAALGASESAAAPGASESAAALGASESAAALDASESAPALGTRASTATGLASAEALHTFTLDSGVYSWTAACGDLSLPSLPRSPGPPCLPCVEGRQRATPHSSEFPPTTTPLQTLHMDE